MSQVNVGPNVAVELFLLEPGELTPGTIESNGLPTEQPAQAE
jgi:hypothetical protein